MYMEYNHKPLLVIGNGKLCYSVCVCLLAAEHSVILVTKNEEQAKNSIDDHFFYLHKLASKEPKRGLLKITGNLDFISDARIGIVITGENLAEKRLMIQQLEKTLSKESIIAINTESIPLNALQESCEHPERLIGLNWVEPAHTTFFLELIINNNTNKNLADNLFDLAKIYWNKDPYLISNGCSIRAKMISVMAREAFYLVQNGYASIEDIDKACRNDAGYYLPFSGNFRYMDLMGTYAYGLVMKDLNPELSKETNLPEFLDKIIQNGGLGMENNNGFYIYGQQDVQSWNEMFITFSYQIGKIIEKYPFNYRENGSVDDTNN